MTDPRGRTVEKEMGAEGGLSNVGVQSGGEGSVVELHLVCQLMCFGSQDISAAFYLERLNRAKNTADSWLFFPPKEKYETSQASTWA